jgi:hypothetical protein
MMQTITVENEWIETAQLFGETERVIKEALQSYFVEQCRRKIREAVERITVYKNKYGADYLIFKNRIQIDEGFLETIHHRFPLWEEDAMEWEFWEEENKLWHTRLETILKS